MRKTNYERDEQTFNADAYQVEGYRGIAFHVLGWHIEQRFEEYIEECSLCDGTGYNDGEDENCRDCDGTGKITSQSDEPEDVRTGMIVARMVGDDRNFVLDQGDVKAIAREEYCGECGQIGCAHDGLDREE